MKVRTKAALLAACAIGAGVLVSTSALPASAAAGDEFIVNGDFSDYDPTTGAITDGVTTTDFSLTTSLNEAYFPGSGDMYDPGVYAVSTNAGSLHNQWVEQAGDNPKMVLNGFTEGVQTVWQQTAAGVTCDVPGSQIQFSFTAEVANVLPLDQYSDGGANIEVFINGQSIGSADLTANDGTPVEISDGLVDAAAEFVIEIRNTATVYIGNDFSIDNLSLVQVGDCLVPTPVAFDVPTTLPTCEAGAQFDAVFPIDADGYTLTVDRPYDGPGVYTITATADEGRAFEGEGDPFVRSVDVTLDGPLSAELEECAPDIGGKTIGFWTNKNGTAAEAAGGLWAQVKAEYPVQTAGLNTFAQAQTFIKNATSSGDGSTMLRAQFFATALNVLYIDGYGEQHLIVPTTSAVAPGETLTVVEYLDRIEAEWASLDTKAERTSVKSVLDAINQDIASDLFV